MPHTSEQGSQLPKSCRDEGYPVISLRTRNVPQFAGFLYTGDRGSGALSLGWRQS